jgi:hypothetical protein
MRAWTAWVQQALGRAGEVALSTATCVVPDIQFGGATLDWNQIKTAKTKSLAVFNHVSDLELDPFHAHACHLIATRATPAAPNDFIFYELAQLAQRGVSHKINAGLAEYAAELKLEPHTSKVGVLVALLCIYPWVHLFIVAYYDLYGTGFASCRGKCDCRAGVNRGRQSSRYVCGLGG